MCSLAPNSTSSASSIIYHLNQPHSLPFSFASFSPQNSHQNARLHLPHNPPDPQGPAPGEAASRPRGSKQPSRSGGAKLSSCTGYSSRSTVLWSDKRTSNKCRSGLNTALASTRSARCDWNRSPFPPSRCRRIYRYLLSLPRCRDNCIFAWLWCWIFIIELRPGCTCGFQNNDRRCCCCCGSLRRKFWIYFLFYAYVGTGRMDTNSIGQSRTSN